MGTTNAENAAVEVIEGKAEAVVLMDIGALAEFATKAVYVTGNTSKKLYEHTVEEAREIVKVRDQNKKKKDGFVALGLNLGRNLLPLDKIKDKTTRLVCSDEQAEAVTNALIAHVKAGLFDEEIAISLAKTKATAEKMGITANKKSEVDAEIPVDGNAVEGLDLEALGTDEVAHEEAGAEETGDGIEQI